MTIETYLLRLDWIRPSRSGGVTGGRGGGELGGRRSGGVAEVGEMWGSHVEERSKD